MADNTLLNLGSGGDTVRDLARQAGTVKTQVVQLDLGGATGNAEVLITAGQQTMAASMPVAIASNQSALPVSGTFWQTTQPVSLASTTITGSVAVTLATAPTTPVTGTFWQATQPVSGTVTANIAAAQTLATVTTVGTVSAITAGPAIGSALYVRNTDGTNVGAVKAASTAAAATDPAQVVQISPINTVSSNLVVSGTAAANTALTVTLPLVAGQFHYIDRIEITRTSTAALAGSATLVVTTTNLPGSLAWSFGNAMAAGGTQIDLQDSFTVPLKSSVVATATTIVMPVPGAAVLWRCNVFYHTGI